MEQAAASFFFENKEGKQKWTDTLTSLSQMAAIHGPVYFWNISISEETLILQQILKGFFSTLTLTIGIALVVLGPFIMFANGIVIAAIWKDPYKQLRSSSSNIIIGSIPACDFLVGMSAIIPASAWFLSMSVKADMAQTFAPVAYVFGDLLLGTSAMHVLGLTIDRVLAVVNPLLYKSRVTRKRALLSVILLWVAAILSTTALRQVDKYYHPFNVASVAFVYIIALVTIGLCCLIIFKVRKQTKIMKNKQEPIALRNRMVAERDRKVTKSILLVLVLFIFCIAWYFVSLIVLLSCSSCHLHLDVVITAYYLAIVMLHINSFINPILYALRIPKFRKPVAFILKKVKKGNC